MRKTRSEEELLAATRSFQRMSARYYWLARDSRGDKEIIYWQKEAADASAYARSLFDRYQEMRAVS